MRLSAAEASRTRAPSRATAVTSSMVRDLPSMTTGEGPTALANFARRMSVSPKKWKNGCARLESRDRRGTALVDPVGLLRGGSALEAPDGTNSSR